MKQERGQSVAEFALVLPLMMLILLGIVQFGMVFKQYITLPAFWPWHTAARWAPIRAKGGVTQC